MRYKLFFAMLLLSLPSMAIASNSILINEIAWMGSTNSANHEWIELYNPSNENIDLTGWQLNSADGSPNILLAGEILSKGYYLLERTNDDSIPNVSADLIYTGSLGNSGENLTLLDNHNNQIDSVISLNQWAAGDNSSKQTMERVDLNNWSNSLLPNGTPKEKNSTAIENEEQAPEEENENNEEANEEESTENTEEENNQEEEQTENILSRCEKKINKLEQRLNRQFSDEICERIERRQERIKTKIQNLIEKLRDKLSHRSR